MIPFEVVVVFRENGVKLIKINKKVKNELQ